MMTPSSMKATTIGGLAREADLVRDDDHRHPRSRKPLIVQHLADQFGIERRGRLVEQQQPRLDRECARNRDALLLAADSWRG